MAHAGTMAPPRVPRIGVQIEVIREKGSGGVPDPHDKRSFFRRLWDGARNLIKVRVR